MKNKIFSSLFLTAAVSMLTLTLGAGLTFAAHPDIPLYTYEEIGMQFTPNFDPANPGGLVGSLPNTNAAYNMMPVMVNAAGKGFPYSPKQTCGNCHNGTTTRWDSGADITDAAGTPIPAGLVSYDDMSDQAFHSELGAQEWMHDADDDPVTAQPGKPWASSTGMWGKW
jgi:hypothetical protein